MKVSWVVVGILTVACSFGFGVWFGQETVEPQINIVEVPVPEIKFIEVPVEPIIKVIKERTIMVPNGFYSLGDSENMTFQEGLDFLFTARYSHQIFIDRGEPMPQLIDANGRLLINGQIGGIEYQKVLVKQYSQAIKLLIRLEGDDEYPRPIK